MIVINEIDLPALTTIVVPFNPLLNSRDVWIAPVAIKNNKYILGEEMLSDPAFAEVLQAIKDAGLFNLLTIREIDPSELIAWPLIQNR